ncbi:MAG: hypothetical protein BWY66_02170 [bacterium ADurb.Bin374]|nr:MAG: hypothetical protein BWY66_02170 [bacterium ADurb.Bin374]
MFPEPFVMEGFRSGDFLVQVFADLGHAMTDPEGRVLALEIFIESPFRGLSATAMRRL